MWVVLRLALLLLLLHFTGKCTDTPRPSDAIEVPANANPFDLNSSLDVVNTRGHPAFLDKSILLSHEFRALLTLCPYMFYECSDLPAYCLSCDFNTSCTYGLPVTVTCKPLEGVYCKVSTDPQLSISDAGSNETEVQSLLGRTHFSIEKQFVCRYCYQLEDRDIVCLGRAKCRQPYVPRSFYETLCEPRPYTLCLGRRVFRRMLPCNWSSGKSYITTVLLSLFLGGFGADRFYLGMWMEGLGKLFSFGGLGIWSVVDFILILSGYLKPPGDAVYW